MAKRRCVATKKDGSRCGGWALRSSNSAGPALCIAHTLRTSSARDPVGRPAVQRCSARTKRGKPCPNAAKHGTSPPLCGSHRRSRFGVPQHRRCKGVTVDGKRCGLTAGSDGFCAWHRRSGYQAPPQRIRCVATRTDGSPCGAWAIIETQHTERPLCVVHAGDTAMASRPPQEKRCTARTAEGERCDGWAMSHTLATEPLCSIHAGLAALQNLAPDQRCQALRRDGQPCQAAAMPNGLCANHAGHTGFEEGQMVRWKHGYYARPTTVELEAISAFAEARMASDPDERRLMLGLCRVMVRRLLASMNDPEVNRGWGVTLRHVKLIFKGIRVIRELVVGDQ